MTSDSAIVIERVSKHYRRDRPNRTAREWLRDPFSRRSNAGVLWALRDVSCRIQPGQMVGVIGKNGAGKSTLLRLIGGVGQPDSGSIQSSGSIRALLDLGSGMHPDLTGRENAFLMGVIGGLTRAQVRQRFDAIVEFAELKEFIDSPLRTYSSGMQMRLAFSIAVHTDPKILLVDEVLAVGDVAFQRKCLDRIQEIQRQGCAIVLVTHDCHAVKEMCDEALWLRAGEVVAFGPARSVVENYLAEMSSETRRRTPVAASADVDSGSGPQLGVNRFGSMEMVIENVRLLDAAGDVVTEVSSGGCVTIEISYRAPARIRTPIFNASIADSNYQVLIDVNTDSRTTMLPDLEGRGSVNLRVARLDLRPGKYTISAGVYEAEWSHAYDFHMEACHFDVCSATRQFGLLHVPHTWSLDVETKPRRSPDSTDSFVSPTLTN